MLYIHMCAVPAVIGCCCCAIWVAVAVQIGDANRLCWHMSSHMIDELLIYLTWQYTYLHIYIYINIYIYISLVNQHQSGPTLLDMELPLQMALCRCRRPAVLKSTMQYCCPSRPCKSMSTCVIICWSSFIAIVVSSFCVFVRPTLGLMLWFLKLKHWSLRLIVISATLKFSKRCLTQTFGKMQGSYFTQFEMYRFSCMCYLFSLAGRSRCMCAAHRKYFAIIACAHLPSGRWFHRVGYVRTCV